MTLGVVLLVHNRFKRAAQMVRLWSGAGCPVVVHVDAQVPLDVYKRFVRSVRDVPDVRFSNRHPVEWGTWSMVAATQDAVALMLEDFATVRHVYLASGACLPLRPVAELQAFLERHPDTDFIESATTADVPWTVGGLDRERFTLRFPFSWKKHRRLFDRWVRLQRRIGITRRIPTGLIPHMGSQWWCLTRQTLEAIQQDPQRPIYDRYFKRVWIPDESYYQSLARMHARQVESRSLTLSKFDFQGKPHIFFDDHRELLDRSGAFVARKIWPHAEGLYRQFPRPADPARADETPRTGTVDRVFSHAVERRTLGRHGLYMHSRFPQLARENGFTAEPYAVLQGFDDIIPDFADWLTRQTGATVHGHLFARDKAHFVDGSSIYRGAIPDTARLRDYNSRMFLTNLIWSARDTHHCFHFGPTDTQDIAETLVADTGANIWIVSGAWSVPLYLSGRGAGEVRAEAARLQTIEDKFLRALREPDTRARFRIVTLADFIDNPLELLQAIIDEIGGHKGKALRALPDMPDLSGLPGFLQDLKNQGMHPFLTGDIAERQVAPARSRRKPYVIGTK